MTPEQKQAIEDYKAMMAAGEPKERVRTMAQGVTLGGADEMEAALRSLLPGQDYDTALMQIRKSLDEYNKAYPKSSLGYEMAGASIPAILTAIATKGKGNAGMKNYVAASLQPKYRQAISSVIGTTTPQTYKGAAGAGVGAGAVYGFNTGEGGFTERMFNAAPASIGGGIAAPALKFAGGAISGIANKVIDKIRQRKGQSVGSLAEMELQRLVRSTGKSVDEVLEDIASGRIMAENADLVMEVRGYYNQGLKPAKDIKDILGDRPTTLRNLAIKELQANTSQFDDPNITRAMKETVDEGKVTEAKAYKQFETVDATAGLMREVENIIKLVPSAADSLKQILNIGGNKLTVKKDGSVSFASPLTISQVEGIRRQIRDTVKQNFSSGENELAIAQKSVQQKLTDAIDLDAPDLPKVRLEAKNRRVIRDAYSEGKNILKKEADEVPIIFSDIQAMGDDAVKAFRSGYMSSLRNAVTTTKQNTLMNKLRDKETKENMILRALYPEESLDEIVKKIDIAADSQYASGKVLSGSPTAGTDAAMKRQGQDTDLFGIVVSGLAGQFSPRGFANALQTYMKKSAPALSEADRGKVVDVLLSNDAAYVKSILKDERGLANLKTFIDTNLARISNVAGARAVPAGIERY